MYTPSVRQARTTLKRRALKEGQTDDGAQKAVPIAASLRGDSTQGCRCVFRSATCSQFTPAHVTVCNPALRQAREGWKEGLINK